VPDTRLSPAAGLSDSGDQTVGGDLTVSGALTVTGDATITQDLTVVDDLWVKGGEPWFDVKAFGATGDGTTDDTTAIQAALDAAETAGGGTVFVPLGTYAIETALEIGDFTHLQLDRDATIKRTANIDNMLRNKADGVAGGYTANSDITVSGGAWDANSTGIGTEADKAITIIAFGHASNVTIRDVSLSDVAWWHCIELNAVQHAIVRDCRLSDTSVGPASEMIQLDLMKEAGAFPWFGPYDDTPCNDILVEGCVFKNGFLAAGSHSGVEGVRHSNIRILGNQFTGFSDRTLFIRNWQDVVIADNVIDDTLFGIDISFLNDTTCRGFAIVGNVLTNITPANNNARGITGNGGNITDRRIRDILVAGNVVRDGGRFGVAFDFAKGVVITGNIIADWGVAGGWLFQTVDAVLSNNRITDNYNIGTGSGTSTNTQNIVVTGNHIGGALVLAEGDNYLVADNILGSISDNGAATNRSIRGNLGHNPQGTATISVGSSPFTYTAGPTPEAVYIRGGTVSDIAKDTRTIFTSTDQTVWLEPGEAVVVTYSSTPTMEKDRK